MEIIDHFSHEHPLILKETYQIRNNGVLVFCSGYEDPLVHSPTYSCDQCHFLLHRSCADLPHEIQHSLHHKHPLLLVAASHFDGRRNVTCNACHTPCISGFTYNCSLCNFHLHAKCASNWKITREESHKHEFTLLRKPMRFTCDACGKDGNAISYLCTICQVLVHKECTSLPRHVRITSHPHRLWLTWSLESDNPADDILCKLCFQTLHSNSIGAVYCCRRCSYVADARCATDESVRDEPISSGVEEDEDQEPISSDEDHGSSICNLRQSGTEEVEESENIVSEIKHLSHQHSLALCNEVKDEKITCDGCIGPITAPFYKCTEGKNCHFYLHRSCAQSPAKKLHPLHPHPLTLLSELPFTGGVFYCDACCQNSHGFAYNCDRCDFYIDLQCSALSESIKHEAHEHQLVLCKTTKGNCNGCGWDGREMRFKCMKCRWFSVDLECVKLPQTVWHRYDDHPLKLTYCSVEDDCGEYYCEICEGRRDPDNWFYYCEKCYFACHPHCVRGNYPQVKLGGRYKLEAHHHPHLVTLVDKTDNFRPCEVCGTPCEGLVFECAECKTNFHRDGYCEIEN